MSRIITLLLAAVLLSLFSACTADGEMDADRLKNIAQKIQEELPSKEAFRDIAEKRIERLPEADRAAARRELQETLDNWPTDREIDRRIDAAIEEFADTAPSKAEVEDAINAAIKELPSKDELKGLIDQLPEGDELERKISEGLGSFFSAIDSVATELEKREQ